MLGGIRWPLHQTSSWGQCWSTQKYSFDWCVCVCVCDCCYRAKQQRDELGILGTALHSEKERTNYILSRCQIKCPWMLSPSKEVDKSGAMKRWHQASHQHIKYTVAPPGIGGLMHVFHHLSPSSSRSTYSCVVSLCVLPLCLSFGFMHETMMCVCVWHLRPRFGGHFFLYLRSHYSIRPHSPL